MKRILITTLLALWAGSALASSTTLKQIDTIQNSSGGSALSVPGTGANLVTDTASQTLTGKTMSGASNTFSAIPASAISSGQLGVANGGTGAATLTLNGMLFGNGTSAVGITAAGSQYQVFQAGASGVPTVGALQLGQAAAVSGQLGVANGGTGASTLTSGAVLIGAGTSSPTFVSPGSNGQVLTVVSGAWASAAATSAAPNVVATFASPTSITAVGGISFSGSNSLNVNYIAGSGGAVTVTASPQVAAGSVGGQQLVLVGTSATNTVKLADGTGLALNGPWTGGLSQTLSLEWDNGASVWREIGRNN